MNAKNKRGTLVSVYQNNLYFLNRVLNQKMGKDLKNQANKIQGELTQNKMMKKI